MTMRTSRFWTRVLAPMLLMALLPMLLAQSAPATAAATTKTFLFKAAKGDQTIYLLGSIHAGEKSMYPLPKEMQTAFKDASALVVEIDVTTLDQMAAANAMLKKGMYPQGDGLSKHLDKDTKAALDAYCTAHGLSPALVERFKPWAAAMTLLAPAMMDAGLDTQLGVDMHFLKAAHKVEKPIIELETPGSQIDLLAGLPDDLQQRFLTATIKEAEKLKPELKKLLAAWKAGDTKTVGDLVLEGTKDSPELMAKLVDDRNTTMHAGITKAAQEHKTLFVVVGAAHIVGDKGLAKLLEKDGYAVRQVTTARPAATVDSPK